MSRKFISFFFASLTGLMLVLVATSSFCLKLNLGGDWVMRANEIKCLSTGTDPFDVWHGDVIKKPFYSFSNPPEKAAENGFTRPLNAYPPYAYTFAAPLGLLPDAFARPIYFLIMLACIGFIFAVGLSVAKKALPSDSDALLATSLSYILLSFAFVSNFQSWNYPFPLLAALLGMAWCLERRHDILAGFCWSLVMIKPQTGLIFAVPLLLRRKFLTCGVAVATCLIASIPPALLCGKSPIALCLESVAGSSDAFIGCGTFPYALCTCVGSSIGTYGGLVIGVLVAIWLTRAFKNDAAWLLYLMPAAFITTVWSYAQLYASAFSWPFFLYLSITLLQKTNDRRIWLLFAGAALFCARPYTFYHGLTMLAPDTLGYSMSFHGHLDSLCSLFSLLVFISFVLKCRKFQN